MLSFFFFSSRKRHTKLVRDWSSDVCSSDLDGRYGDDFMLYRAISQEAPEAMAGKVAGYRAEGYRKFQLKVGGDPETDTERIRAVSAELQIGRTSCRERV